MKVFKQTLSNLYCDTASAIAIFKTLKLQKFFCNSFPKFSQCNHSSCQDVAPQENAHIYIKQVRITESAKQQTSL